MYITTEGVKSERTMVIEETSAVSLKADAIAGGLFSHNDAGHWCSFMAPFGHQISKE